MSGREFYGVKCVRRECARLTLHTSGHRPQFCPHCTAEVVDTPLVPPTPLWHERPTTKEKP